MEKILKIVFFKKLLNIFVFFFSIVVFIITFKSTDINDIIDIFYRPEFYVNYSGGYVRRGLDGEIIYLISKNLKIQPWLIQKTYSLFCFLLFILLTIYTMIKRKININSVFSMSCFLLFLFFSSHGFRKDHILLLIFLLNCYYIKSIKKSQLTFSVFILQNIISLVGILIHEVFFAFSLLPLITIYFIKYRMMFNLKKIYQIAFLFIIPGFIFFLNSTLFSGTAAQEKIIIDSWKQMGLNNIQFYSGIFGKPHFIWMFFNNILDYLILFSIFIIHLIFNFSTNYENHKKNKTHVIFAFLLIFQFIIAILLTIVASDFSRWIFFATYTTIFSISFIENNSSKKLTYKCDYNLNPNILAYTSFILYFFTTSTFSTEDGVRNYFHFLPLNLIIDFFKIN